MLRRPFKRQGSGLGGPRKKFKPPRRIAGGAGSHALGGAGACVPSMPPPATAAPRSAVDPSQRRSSADTTRPAATRPVATTTFSSSSASPAAGAAAGADAAAFKAPAAPIASHTLVRKVIRPGMVLNSYGANPKASIATTTSTLTSSSASSAPLRTLSQTTNNVRLKQRRGFKPPSRMMKSASHEASKPSFSSSLPSSHFRMPRGAANSAQKAVGQAKTAALSYWTCLYTKRSHKKHKVYDDGVIVLDPSIRRCTLYDMKNKKIATTRTTFTSFRDDEEIDVLNKEVQIVKRLKDDDYLSGSIFVQGQASSSSSSSSGPSVSAYKMNPSSRKKKFLSHAAANVPRKSGELPKPRHNPLGANAIVLSPGVPGRAVAVVVDPHLGKFLRPHQVDGVRFLYKCVTGRSNPDKPHHCGCILADEMGLGKTLQSIALIWTLIKQSEKNGQPLVKKAVIVTPSSLVMNWAGEFRKWLGIERCEPTAVNTTGKHAREQVQNFLQTSSSQGKGKVLILSYEMCVKYHDLITNGKEAVGLLVCDEGHRLKNAKGNKTIRALRQFKTNRIVLLTGTPVQNRLSEFFAMADFCNHQVLGDVETFKKVYQVAIDQGRDKNASKTTKELGEIRSKALAAMTSLFVLRRTSEVNQKYLPARHEIAVFCKLTPTQMQMYNSVVMNSDVSRFRNGRKMREGSDAQALPVISALTQICNHPELMRGANKTYLQEASQILQRLVAKKSTILSSSSSLSSAPMMSSSSMVANATAVVPALDTFLSGKMGVLMALLSRCRQAPEKDRFVVVSNYTRTLDVIQQACNDLSWPFCRLDGSTKNSLRQPIVDAFNAPGSKSFIFLLSSKAGGCGLNLIGANRIVLFDPAWNPATDRQAMARVWRDGQRKQVYIYRMLSTGTVEERIFQRQILKEEVAKAVVDRDDDDGSSSMNSGGRHFSPSELRKLFAPPKDTICDTYDLISQLKLAKAPKKRENISKKKSSRKEKVELSDSDSNIDDHLNEDLSSSHDDGFSDDSWYGSDESADDDDGNSKAIANRTFMFPMYRGPGSVKDTVLRNVIESGEDNKLITFVRTQSIYPGRGEGARELKKKEL